MSVSEQFVDIRKQFQKLHAELDQYMLFLEGCNCTRSFDVRNWPGDKTQIEAAEEHSKVPFELLGLMQIPIVHPKHNKSLFVNDRLDLFHDSAAAAMDEQNRQEAQYQIAGFQEADQRLPRRLKVAYLRCPNKTTGQFAHEFRRLAEQTGAPLPTVVTDAIPTFLDTNSYVDRWLQIVFRQHQSSLENL